LKKTDDYTFLALRLAAWIPAINLGAIALWPFTLR
jgi:hypothetical protein